jgi:hypothetical protein
MKQYKYIFPVAAIIAILVVSCRKEIIRNEPDAPFNPYDTVDYSNGAIDDVEIDSASFLGLHTYIFSKTCAVPGCHDGSFEPDFRTVQSAYNTLLFAPVIKNDDDGTFTYRVIPGDTALSWLHERITTDDEILGRMPLYDTLYPQEREKITQWILNGAPDVFGQVPEQADFQPTTYGYVVYENDTTGMRLDTNRNDFLSPVEIPIGSTAEFWFGFYDTDENGVYQLPSTLVQNKIRISQDMFMDDYVEYEFELEPNYDPFYGPTYYDPAVEITYWHHFTINADAFEPNKVYFMRAYIQDNAHDFLTEIPDNSQLYVMGYFSFIIQ